MDHHEPASTRHSPNSRWAEQQRSRLHRRRSPQQETRSRNPGLCLVPAAERCETTEVRRAHPASPRRRQARRVSQQRKPACLLL
jgi:hypothetical protein